MNCISFYRRLLAAVCLGVCVTATFAQTFKLPTRNELLQGIPKSLTWHGNQFVTWCNDTGMSCKKVKMSDKIGKVNQVIKGDFLLGVSASWLAVSKGSDDMKDAEGVRPGDDLGYLCALRSGTMVSCVPLNAPVPSTGELKGLAATANFTESSFEEFVSARPKARTLPAFVEALRAAMVEFQNVVDTSSESSIGTLSMRTCQEQYESCRSACDNAYESFARYCSGLANPYERQGCHSYNSELYASCLSDCEQYRPR